MKPAALGLAALLALSLPLPAPAATDAPPPFKGLVLWPDQARDLPGLSAAISLEFAYVTPCSLVPGADPDGSPRYDWAPLERLLDDIASRGHQAILRFRYEYPGETIPEYPGVRGATAVPKHVKALPGYRETHSPNPGGDGPTWYADWSHPGLRAFTLRFFRDAFARYDADPRIAFWEIGFGHWSEYHTSGTPVRLGANFPSKEFQAELLRLADDALRATPWLVSIDAAQPKYSDLAADPALAALGFGLFDDSFMHREHDQGPKSDGYNQRCWRAFGPDRWRRAPCGGEISYYSRRDQREFLSPRGLYGVTWEQAAAAYHMTFVIANDSPDGKFATPGRFREAAAACGYDLRLVRAESAADGALEGAFANDGVAPPYHDIRPALDGRRADTSLRGLAPGETRPFRIPPPDAGDAPVPGDPAARLALVSDKLLPGASVPFRRPAP